MVLTVNLIQAADFFLLPDGNIYTVGFTITRLCFYDDKE